MTAHTRKLVMLQRQTVHMICECGFLLPKDVLLNQLSVLGVVVIYKAKNGCGVLQTSAQWRPSAGLRWF